MDRLFLTVLNMSISAAFCILAVILVRLLLARAPKIFSYLLWAVVMVRLVCPVLPEADFGLIPDAKMTKSRLVSTETTHEYYAVDENGQSESPEEIHGGFAAGVDSNAETAGEDNTEAEFVYLPSEKVSTKAVSDLALEKGLRVITGIWGFTAFGLMVYAGAGYAVFLRRIKRKEVTTPCVTGFLHPMVYLPDGLDEVQKQLVIEHEMIHIRRLDYLVKPLAFLVCCIHWFNPFVWVFFFLMERDMETSCDEAVVQKIGYDRRRDYANTLLNLSQNRGWRAGYPIAFGESHVKNRIKGVVKMKKAGIGVSAAAVVLLLAAAAFLLINRAEGNTQEPEPVTISYQPDEHVAVKESEPSKAEADPKENMYLFDQVDTEIRAGEQEESTFSLPDIKEYLFFPNEDSSEDNDSAYLPSPTLETENQNQETIMNYDPARARDQFEVLNLPQVDEFVQDTEIDVLILPQIDESFRDTEILFTYPVEGARISGEFGSRIHPVSGAVLFHLGMDFAAEAGTPITAAADGTVVKTGFDSDCGNYLILLHENGAATYYCHCQDILAEEGAKVKSGEPIAAVGSTGRSTGPHLHFGVSRGGDYIEPVFIEEE